jgi:hypothetical protein
MKSSEIKKLLISSLDEETDTAAIHDEIEREVVSYDFSGNFSQRVLEKVYSSGTAISRQVEFIKYMNFAFYRVALTGVAAIVILLISLFFIEGSFSLNSLLGLNDNYDESIICLLTGN